MNPPRKVALLLRRGSFKLGLSGAFSAVLGFVCLVVVARWSTPAEYQNFVVIWSLYFGLAGILIGLQQQVTLSLYEHSSIEGATSRADPVRGHLLAAPLSVIAGTIAVLAATIFVAAVDLSPVQGFLAFLTVLVGATLLTLASAFQGLLAAEARWDALTWSSAADQTIRLAAVLLAVWCAPNSLTFVIAIFAGTIAYAPLLPRSLRGRTLDEAIRTFSLRACAAMLATGCSNLLLVGLPFLLAVTGSVSTTIGPSLFAAIFLTRSPLLVPVNVLRPIILRMLFDKRDRLRNLVWMRLVPCGVALASLGMGTAWLLGPWLLAAIFGPEYVLSRMVVSALAGASVLMLAAILSGMAAVALGKDAMATIGWVVATIVAVIVLTLPLDVVTRCVAAMIAGPVMALAIHLRALVD